MNGKVTIVGLGYGDQTALSLGVLGILENSEKIYLRTEKHPVTTWLQDRGLVFSSLDVVYEAHDSFEAVYEEIASLLLEEASSGPLVYAVPGHPMVAERTVQLLLSEGKARGIKIDVKGGGSFLDIAFARLHIDPIEGFLFLDGSSLDEKMLNTDVHLLLGQVYSRMVASDAKLSLMEFYPEEHPVKIVQALGIESQETILELALYELDRGEYFNDLTSVYVAPLNK